MNLVLLPYSLSLLGSENQLFYAEFSCIVNNIIFLISLSVHHGGSSHLPPSHVVFIPKSRGLIYCNQLSDY